MVRRAQKGSTRSFAARDSEAACSCIPLWQAACFLFLLQNTNPEQHACIVQLWWPSFSARMTASASLLFCITTLVEDYQNGWKVLSDYSPPISTKELKCCFKHIEKCIMPACIISLLGPLPQCICIFSPPLLTTFLLMLFLKLLHLVLQRKEAIWIPNIPGRNKEANTLAQSFFELLNLLFNKRGRWHWALRKEHTHTQNRVIIQSLWGGKVQ